jgi:hypothetical protein
MHHKSTQAPRSAIRAAAHHSSSSGIARPAVQFIAGPPVVQRMIKKDFFEHPSYQEVKDIQTLRHIILSGEVGKDDFYFVNNRAQTFKQAVGEFIKTGAPKHQDVKEHWANFWKEETVNMAKYYLGKIAGIINDVKSEYPDHPNAFWPDHRDKPEEGAAHEARGTIPQTPESRQIANALWELLNAEDAKLKKEAIEGTVGHEGKKKENFMLGVLVFPNKHVIVTASGQIKDISILRRICLAYLEGSDFVLDGVFDTKNITEIAQHCYDESFERATGKKKAQFSKKDGDLGNKPGTCAAAVALGIEAAFTAGNFQERKRGATGKVRLGLTETFTGGTVTVSNRLVRDSEQKWPKAEVRGEYDIPSCETCQHQLHSFALDLVVLDKKQRLERFYPEQKVKLPEEIKAHEDKLGAKLGEKKATDIQFAEADSIAQSAKKKLSVFRDKMGKESLELYKSLRQLEEESEKVAAKKKSGESANEKALEYCSNYLMAKAPGNNNSFKNRAAAMWWKDFCASVPEMEKVGMADREKKATEYKEKASPKKSNDSGGGDVPFKQQIDSLKDQIRELDDELARQEKNYKEKQLSRDQLRLSGASLDSMILDLKNTIAILQGKLARHDDKMRRERFALHMLEKK